LLDVISDLKFNLWLLPIGNLCQKAKGSTVFGNIVVASTWGKAAVELVLGIDFIIIGIKHTPFFKQVPVTAQVGEKVAIWIGGHPVPG
jgi:hypothetical protein